MNLGSYRIDTQVAVRDMTQAAEFYETKLGLEAVRSGADGSKVYAADAGTLLAVYPSPATAGTSSATLASWQVDDVGQVVDGLTSRGVTFEHYEGVLDNGVDYSTDERGISPQAGGGRIAWFKDPDGNIFAVEGDR